MKTRVGIIFLIVLIIAMAGIGYFGLPILMEKETSGLRSDIQDIKQRLQKIEEESKAAPLKPEADVQKVIKTVNAIYHKGNSLEDSFKKGLSETNEAIKRQGKTLEEAFKNQTETLEKQKTTMEAALKKQAEALDKVNKETQTKIQGIMFDAAMANIRGHLLKARVEIAAKNVGIAKSELDLIDGLFIKAAEVASDENKKTIKELQGILKKTRAEIDTDLPAAINRIDLLWYEMGKLLRKV